MSKPIVNYANNVQLAIEMVKLGARTQVINSYVEGTISYERLQNLYYEVLGRGATKGQLPSSTTWYGSWRGLVQSTVFYNIYNKIEIKNEGWRMVKAYRLFLEYLNKELSVSIHAENVQYLDFNRAWFLLRLIRCGEIEVDVPCTECGLEFISIRDQPNSNFVCCLCAPPSRIISASKRIKS